MHAAENLLRELRRFADRMDRDDAARVDALEAERKELRDMVTRMIGDLEEIPGTVTPGERASGLRHETGRPRNLRETADEFARASRGSERYSELARKARELGTRLEPSPGARAAREAQRPPSRPLRFNMAGQEPREDKDRLAAQPAATTTHESARARGVELLARRRRTARKGR